jgi:hypothetical protein
LEIPSEPPLDSGRERHTHGAVGKYSRKEEVDSEDQEIGDDNTHMFRRVDRNPSETGVLGTITGREAIGPGGMDTMRQWTIHRARLYDRIMRGDWLAPPGSIADLQRPALSIGVMNAPC